MRRLAIPGLLLAASATGQAHAQTAPVQTAPAQTAPAQTSPAEPGAFVATKIDVGFAYLRPRLSAGYGSPRGSWVGLDGNPLLSRSATGGYLGLRLANPRVDLRSGMLEAYSFRHSFMPPRAHYDLRDVERVTGVPAFYVAWTSELTLDVPVGPGALYGESEAVCLLGVPDDQHVLYEDFPAVAAPPWLARQRLGYTITLDIAEGMVITPVAELIWVPERDDTQIWRAGLTWRWNLSPTVELRAAVVPVVSSPDRLGLFGGDVGDLGVRYTWSNR